MKSALVVVLLLGSVAPAHADDNKALWTGVLVGSLTLTVGGAYLAYDGWRDANAVRDEQCRHGVEPPGETNCTGRPGLPPLTQQQLDELNQRGDRAALQTNIGWGITFVGVALSGVALYQVLTIKPRNDQAVTIAPTMSRHSAGAALKLTW